jgi:hypothetical protein
VAAEQASALVAAVSQLAEPVEAAALPVRVPALAPGPWPAELVGAVARPARMPALVAVSQLAAPVGAMARPVLALVVVSQLAEPVGPEQSARRSPLLG